jgi:6-phosphogluconolactonase
MQASVKFWSVITIGMALCSAPLRAEVVYMTNAAANNVGAYHLHENGALTPLTGSPFPTGLNPAAVVVDVPGRLLFVLNTGNETISIFRINLRGNALTWLTQVNTAASPTAVAVDPFGRFLYVTNIDGTLEYPGGGGFYDHVYSYRIGINGSLTPVVGSPALTEISPVSLVADLTGQFVYAGNSPFTGDGQIETISGYRVNGNGSLTPLPGSPFPNGQGPQAMAVDPFGRFLYAAGVYALSLETYKKAGTGVLTQLPSSSFPPNGGDGYFDDNTVAASPLGRFVYQLENLYPDPMYPAFSIYRVGANGLTLVSKQKVESYSAAVAVDFTERFLFAGATEYQIGANGSLTALPLLSLGFEPSALAVSPW